MRRKLIALTLGLLATAAAQGLFLAPSSEAAPACPHLVCCPKGPCYCCPYPCLVQCP